jgi:hypothetical protein
VAGQNAYLLSRSGATEIASSGFHKEIFCYDDFLNLANSRRRNASSNAGHSHHNGSEGSVLEQQKTATGNKTSVTKQLKALPRTGAKKIANDCIDSIRPTAMPMAVLLESKDVERATEFFCPPPPLFCLHLSFCPMKAGKRERR